MLLAALSVFGRTAYGLFGGPVAKSPHGKRQHTTAYLPATSKVQLTVRPAQPAVLASRGVLGVPAVTAWVLAIVNANCEGKRRQGAGRNRSLLNDKQWTDNRNSNCRY